MEMELVISISEQVTSMDRDRVMIIWAHYICPALGRLMAVMGVVPTHTVITDNSSEKKKRIIIFRIIILRKDK